MHSAGTVRAAPPTAKTGDRYGWIDYARGIAITLIVFGHTGGGFSKAGAAINAWPLDICQTVYYSRMPLFFVVSGLFVRRSLAKRGLAAFVRYKFDTILYPYLIWASVQLAVQVIMYQYGLANAPRQWSDFARLVYDPHGLDQFWFLYVLFAVALLYALLQTYAKLTAGVLVALGLVGYVASFYIPSFYFGLKTSAEFFFFLAIGDWASRWVFVPANERLLASWGLFAVILPIFLALHAHLFHHFAEVGRWVIFSWERWLLIATVFVGLAFIINVSFLLARTGGAKWLRFIGRHSLYIYMLHIIVAAGSRAVLLKLGGGQYPNISLYMATALAIGLPIGFYQLTKHFGWWYLFSLEKKAAGD
jgi:fucose 4-O-acetylase-like acetyltransferase